MNDRPVAVPAAAWWSAADDEWILGARDDQGRLTGVVSSWRPDGSLVCTCAHVAGKPHGISVRYHETGEVAQRCHFVDGVLHGVRAWWSTDGETTENPRAARAWRGELHYLHGTLVAVHAWNRADVPVDSDGAPLPPRPAGVPDSAQPTGTDWVTVENDVVTRWTADGVRRAEERHGATMIEVTSYRRDDGSRRSHVVWRRPQQLVRADAWRRDGSPFVHATFGALSRIVHLAGGDVVRETTYAAPPAPPGVPTSEADAQIFDAIDAGHAPEAGAQLSARGLAAAIARGWTGDGDRDVRAARRYRGLVLQLAPPPLRAELVRQQLDRMPRLVTGARVRSVVAALAPYVHHEALVAAVIAEAGPGRVLAATTPAFLASLVTDGTLALANLGLTELGAEVGRLSDVRTIYAPANQLTTVPPAVGDLVGLTRLDLTNNRITSLPRSLAWLPELSTLLLGYNALATLPDVVCELSDLRTLDLADNPLPALPEAFGDLAALHTLRLSRTQLHALPRSFAQLRALTVLHLGDTRIADLSVLAALPRLETLWLPSPAHLLPEIAAMPQLRALTLGHAQLTEVPAALFHATQLRELRISSSPLPAGTLERLREALPTTKIY